MIEQNNLDLMQQMISDHQERLRVSVRPRTRRRGPGEPNRIRTGFGRMLIQLGETVRGAQPTTSDRQPAQLALGE